MHNFVVIVITTSTSSTSRITESEESMQQKQSILVDSETESEDEGGRAGDGYEAGEEMLEEGCDERMSWLHGFVNYIISVLGFVFVALPLGMCVLYLQGLFGNDKILFSFCSALL